MVKLKIRDSFHQCNLAIHSLFVSTSLADIKSSSVDSSHTAVLWFCSASTFPSYICTCVCVYIYLYIRRERQKEFQSPVFSKDARVLGFHNKIAAPAPAPLLAFWHGFDELRSKKRSIISLKACCRLPTSLSWGLALPRLDLQHGCTRNVPHRFTNRLESRK